MPEDFLYFWKGSDIFSADFVFANSFYHESELENRDNFACYCMMSV